MAVKKSAPKTAQTTTTRKQPVRQAITLEAVIARAPHGALAENLSRTFGIDCPDYNAIRETTEESVVRGANALCDDLNPKAMEIHLQRIVGSFVSSASGAAGFYQTKVTTAKDLTMASQNSNRDEDRDGVSGFQSKAENARLFAAQMGLQAYALMAAAEGATHAYAHITGEDWKPYEAPMPATSSTSRKSADEEMGAFGYTWGLNAAALAREAEVPGFSTHVLRHLRLTDLARAGLDITEIANFAGHRPCRC